MDDMKTRFVTGLALASNDFSEKILVVESRSQGRRMLQWLAGQGVTLLNIGVETPLTLATALCQSFGSPPMTNTQGERLVLSLLKEETEGFYHVDTAQTPTVARALYQTFLELAMAKAPPLQGEGRLTATQKLRQRYEEEKIALGQMDRSDLFCHGIRLAHNETCWKNTRFFALSTAQFTPLEQDFLAILSRGNLGQIDMPQGEAVNCLERERCRFLSCRGMETEIRAVFRDILQQKQPISDCVLVYLGAEYASAIYRAAPRWDIPVTMGGGIPLSESRLSVLLQEMVQFTAEQYPVERLYKLLTTGSCTPSHPLKLAKLLSQRPMSWGKELYTLEQEGRSTETQQVWQDFLTCILSMGEGALPLDVQQAQIQNFLAHYTPLYPQGEQGAYATILELLDSAASVATEGTSLLSDLVSAMENSTYLPSVSSPTSLLCLPLNQGLLSGRKNLYIVGLSRYALESGGTQSPILLDCEREALSPPLATVSSRGQQFSAQFNQLILSHPGTFTFLYSNFESGHMSKVEPSPFYQQGLEQLEADETSITYLPNDPLTAGDFLLLHPNATVSSTHISAGTAPAEQDVTHSIQGFRFSASSLEGALACPFRFYLERILQLREDTPQPIRSDRWLNPNTRGTFVHQVLEDYFTDQMNPHPLAFDVMYQQAVQQLEQDNPCLYPETEQAKAKELPEIRQMVEGAIQWTRDQGRTVRSTEQTVGTTEAPITLKIGDRKILFVGSIDRVDQVGNQIKILDYKSGDARSFKSDMELHLQHYLYTLAYEQTHPGVTVHAAGYLLLNQGVAYQELEQTPALRQEMKAKIVALLDILSCEDTIQTPRPCYTLQQGTLVEGPRDIRQTSRNGCRHYCPYAKLCTPYWEEVSDT